MPKPVSGGVTIGKTLRWVAVLNLVQGEGTTLGYLHCASREERIILKEGRELFGRFDVVLCIDLEPGACLTQSDGMSDTGEHILQHSPTLAVVQNLGRCYKGKLVPGCATAQTCLVDNLLCDSVSGNETVESILKAFTELTDVILRPLLPVEGALCPQEADGPSRVLTDLHPAHSGLSLCTADPSLCNEPAEIGIALSVLGQNHDTRPIVDGDLRTDDQVQSKLPGLDVSSNGTVHSVSVSKSQSRKAVLMTPADELPGMTGSLEERIVALTPQRGVGHYSTMPLIIQRRSDLL